MRRREFLAATGAASAAAVAGCSVESSTDGSDRGADADPDPPPATATAVDAPTATPTAPEEIHGWISERRRLRPVSAEAYVGDRATGVRGVLENVSPRRLRGVAVELYFYDGRTFVGDGLDDTAELGPGAEWEFDAAYRGDRPWDTYVGMTKYER